MGTFSKAGFITCHQQDDQQNGHEKKFTMEDLHFMLQELYKAIMEKVFMENAAMFAALKNETTSIKKEHNDLSKGCQKYVLEQENP
ncbi:hypothetical protein EV44_g1314 [Erysiphe necator]|uniref:Uncharacterized protein n=1 Tax=Uncinula necator TaxID=52586 RepID=A0A0B1P0X2_UNCNE|nr:hypothetical protein EV44_g1314 [Erysiphe necator]